MTYAAIPPSLFLECEFKYAYTKPNTKGALHFIVMKIYIYINISE